jgi:hypothetical protein
MVTMNQNAWEKRVAPYVAEVENVPVPKGTDTTAMSALHAAFIRYLTHSQAKVHKPYTVKLGQAYHADGVYYLLRMALSSFCVWKEFRCGV